ncbi:FtsB family cell division protein [Pallidibacillus pasinlerensis]|uniref:Septum formation initiator family protein n=1 Tax=Pallidibacillus pasinlerensis TaxID=2703818 RepID=A0ABX0A5E8_9BACI|nr:septum formation initiator family protein [Pallidibacillus pasinlerensis]NCU17736.1 septum formation initiator family protein [Pallidibacillus pasinlerensis]
MSGKNKRIPIINQSYMNKQNQQKLVARRKKKLLIRRLTVFSIFACIVIISFTLTLKFQKETLSDKQKQLDELQVQSEKLEKEKKILQDEITKLQDDEYIGKYVRQEYYLSDEGEIIFTVPEDDQSDESVD